MTGTAQLARVESAAGRIEGDALDGLSVFKGIPFAQPPVGALRFRAPEPLAPASRVISAHAFGPSPQQLPVPFKVTPGADLYEGLREKSEDCLYLNIWTPSTEKRLPVMVYVYGGSFQRGSSSQLAYDGRRLALEGDVVVVTFNHRVDALGFLDLEVPGWSTNFGLLDQVAALRWVRDNIAAFGGDPDRVTLFGESSGAVSIGMLAGSQAADGLLHRAIMSSGGGRRARNRDESHELAAVLMRNLQLEPGDAEGVRAAPVQDLLQAAAGATLEVTLRRGLGVGFQPVLDGDLLSVQAIEAAAAGRMAGIPMIAGHTRDELRMWQAADPGIATLDLNGLRQRTALLLGDRYLPAVDAFLRLHPDDSPGDTWMTMLTQAEIAAPTRELLEAQQPHNPEVYAYLFTVEAATPGLRSCHALDVPFVFGTLGLEGFNRLVPPTTANLSVADEMRAAWAAFAHGRPPTAGGIDWPRYDTERRATRVFGSEERVAFDPMSEERKAWPSN